MGLMEHGREASEHERRNAAFVRAVFEQGWNGQEFDVLRGSTIEEIPFRYNGTQTVVTPQSLPGLVSMWRSAFPDLEMTIHHLVACDDLVAVASTLRGTHRSGPGR